MSPASAGWQRQHAILGALRYRTMLGIPRRVIQGPATHFPQSCDAGHHFTNLSSDTIAEHGAHAALQPVPVSEAIFL